MMKMKIKGMAAVCLAAVMMMMSAVQASGMSLTQARNVRYSYDQRSPSATEMFYDAATKKIIVREIATFRSYQGHEDGTTHIALSLYTWDFEIDPSGKARALQELFYDSDNQLDTLEYYMIGGEACGESTYEERINAYDKMAPISLNDRMRPLSEGYVSMSGDDFWRGSKTDSMRVLVGQSVQLPTGIIPAQDAAVGITYKSSDSSVLQVFENGSAVGLKSGICTVSTYAEGISEPISEVKVNVMSLQEIDYIFPQNNRLLTEEDVKGLTSEQINIAINEIYAQHGMKYTDDTEMGRYIRSKDWYNKDSEKTIEEAAENMTENEDANLKLLASFRT